MARGAPWTMGSTLTWCCTLRPPREGGGPALILPFTGLRNSVCFDVGRQPSGLQDRLHTLVLADRLCSAYCLHCLSHQLVDRTDRAEVKGSW
ncbi:hypothetical protein EYF80_044360 [Liparis tanakae]|uniref:Uncharacterized protein n=1 Tax=Liparis tanakae TaxID=230148 RepID=A0A4Z2FX35_9TELE|nr:hypothetical protein EYF80_044360 [Liparis tanakae]